jgi:carbohydrate diacid regulator
MYINATLADQIAQKAQAILQRKIMVAGTDGQILFGEGGMTDKVSREALQAAQEGRSLTQSNGETVKWVPFVYENQTIGVFGIILEDGQITPEAVSLLQGLAEVIVHQYFLLDRLQSTESLRANFITEILQDHTLPADEAHRQADILQLNLRLPQAVLLIHLHDFEKTLDEQFASFEPQDQVSGRSKAVDEITRTVRESFQSYKDNIICYAGRDTFILLKGIGGDNINSINTIRFLKDKAQYLFDTLSKLHQKPLTIGVGQYYPDLGGLRKSYQDAKLALNIGIKVWGPGRIHHIKDVGMFITLANVNQERKAELAHQILSPLLKNQQLFKTVDTFLSSNLNLTIAANRLHIHRNTLIYRLDKTKKLINLDPRRFEDALQIRLGLMFYNALQTASAN